MNAQCGADYTERELEPSTQNSQLRATLRVSKPPPVLGVDWGNGVISGGTRVELEVASWQSHAGTHEDPRRQFKHPIKSGRVAVAGHERAELKPKTLNSVLSRQV
jgi:hypothetical protein